MMRFDHDSSDTIHSTKGKISMFVFKYYILSSVKSEKLLHFFNEITLFPCYQEDVKDNRI